MAKVNLDILLRATDATRGALVGVRQNLRAIDRDTSGLRGSLDKLDRSLGGMQNSLNASAQRWQHLGAVASQAGRTIAIAGAALLGFSAVAMREAMGFDRAMRNVNSIAQLSERELGNLKEAVKGVASDPTVRESITTLAEGLYDIYSSGLEGQLGLEALKISAQGASAGLSSTATAAQILVAVMNAYNMKTGPEAQHIMDVLFATVDRGVITFEELAQHLGQVVGTSAAAGVSLEEVGAALMTMTKRGNDAAISTTALNRIITSFLNPSKEMAAAIKAAGFESGAALLKTKGLAGAMKFLTEATGGNVDQLVMMLGEIRSVRAALALTGTGAQMFADDLKAMGDVGGSTMRALAQQSRSFAFQLDKLKQQLGILLDAIGGPMLAALGKLLSPLMALMRVFSWMIQNIPGLNYVIGGSILALGLLFATIGPLLMALPGMIGAWNLLTAALQRNAAAAAAAGAANAAAGAGAAAGGAGASAGAAGRLLGPLRAIAPMLIAAFAGAWASIAPILAGVSAALGSIVAGVQTVVAAIGAVAAAIAGLPVWIIVAIVAAVTALGIGIWQLVKHWGAVKSWFADLWASIGAGLQGTAEAVMQFGQEIGAGFVSGLQAAWEGFLGFFSNLPRNLGRALGQSAQAVVYGVAWIVGALQELPRTIPALLQQAWVAIQIWAVNTYTAFTTWAAGVPAAIANGLTAAYQGIANWAQAAWLAIASWATNTYSSIAAWVAGLPGLIADGMAGLWQTFTEWLERIWQDISQFFARVWQGFLDLPRRAGEALRGVGEEFAGGVKEGAGDLAGAAAAGQRAGQKSVEVHNHFEGPTYGVEDLDAKIERTSMRAGQRVYSQTQYGWSGA